MTYLTISVCTHAPRVVTPVHPHVLVTAPVSVVKVLITFLSRKIWASIAVIHGHAFIGPVVFSEAGAENQIKKNTIPTDLVTSSASWPSLLTCHPCRKASSCCAVPAHTAAAPAAAAARHAPSWFFPAHDASRTRYVIFRAPRTGAPYGLLQGALSQTAHQQMCWNKVIDRRLSLFMRKMLFKCKQ